MPFPIGPALKGPAQSIPGMIVLLISSLTVIQVTALAVEYAPGHNLPQASSAPQGLLDPLGDREILLSSRGGAIAESTPGSGASAHRPGSISGRHTLTPFWFLNAFQ